MSASFPPVGPTPQRPVAPGRRSLLLAVGLGVMFGLVGIGAFWALRPAASEERATACRTTIPALNPEGSRYHLGSPVAGAFSDSVRVSYVVETPDKRVRRREVTCRFEPARDDAPPRISGIATEAGPLSDSSFYFLRRFYLETADGPPPDPASARANASGGQD